MAVSGQDLSSTLSSKRRFSVMLWILSKTMTMEQRLQIVADAGYDGGEMTNEWMKWTPEETRRIIAKKDRLGLTFDAIFPTTAPLNHPDSTQRIREDVMKAIPFAQQIGCPMFLVRSGQLIPGQSDEAKRAQIVDHLKMIGDLSAAKNISLLLEPIDHIEAKAEAVDSVTEGFELTHATGNPMVKVLYDLYHEQRGGGNLIEKLQKHIDQVGLIHIADVPGRKKPGTGEIDYPNIYRALAKLPYTGYITMEFYDGGDPVAELKAAKAEVLAAMDAR
jgi:hydroxypyruvate isomerase